MRFDDDAFAEYASEFLPLGRNSGALATRSPQRRVVADVTDLGLSTAPVRPRRDKSRPSARCGCTHGIVIGPPCHHRRVRYRYEDLGDEEFQQLVQALLAHALGPMMRAMPLGKADGGRDALHATAVFQVKFTIAPDKVRDPVDWLLAALDAEVEKIRALGGRGARSYYLVTTSVPHWRLTLPYQPVAERH